MPDTDSATGAIINQRLADEQILSAATLPRPTAGLGTFMSNWHHDRWRPQKQTGPLPSTSSESATQREARLNRDRVGTQSRGQPVT
jgi:hypothetical protein